MHRFYTSLQNISANKIIISDKKQVHHIKDVLRLNINNTVKIFDEKGNEYICLIKELVNNQVILGIKNRLLPKTHKVKITIACALPKKSKMDEIIDKLTQLGVKRIIPLKTARVVIKLDRHKEIEHWWRWNKIAQSASEQSQRNTLPIVDKIKDISEVLSNLGDFDLKLIPTLKDARKSIKEIFINSKPNNILVLIGPEGDFTDEEIELAKKSGCIPVSLGELVLRVETAAIAVASYIRLFFI